MKDEIQRLLTKSGIPQSWLKEQKPLAISDIFKQKEIHQAILKDIKLNLQLRDSFSNRELIIMKLLL